MNWIDMQETQSERTLAFLQWRKHKGIVRKEWNKAHMSIWEKNDYVWHLQNLEKVMLC